VGLLRLHVRCLVEKLLLVHLLGDNIRYDHLEAVTLEDGGKQARESAVVSECYGRFIFGAVAAW
jgi:hypothetical protein